MFDFNRLRTHRAHLRFMTWLFSVLLCHHHSDLRAEFPFEQEPIHYTRQAATDRVAKLQQQIKLGNVQLDADSRGDYLASLLKALEISPSSQSLVFSKTSLQVHAISPETPRAIYFNDDVYVGWVQNGYMIEIASMDDQLGGVFYTIRLGGTHPRIDRDRTGCLSCHASQRTERVPGFFIRSVIPTSTGKMFETGTVTDHRSDYQGRWGGWYVTGQHGAMRHLGNEFVSDPPNEEQPIDRERSANLVSLAGRVDTSPYPSTQSDIVALMVMEHQVGMHNRITRANYDTRKALAAPDDSKAQAQMHESNERLVEYLLFCDEPKLPSPVQGEPAFVDQFAARAKQDSRGHSLRDFDLQTRLFKYPCSYLIYSSAFDAIPEPSASYLKQRVLSVLGDSNSVKSAVVSETTISDDLKRFKHLSAEDRSSILQILRETKPSWFVASTL